MGCHTYHVITCGLMVILAYGSHFRHLACVVILHTVGAGDTYSKDLYCCFHGGTSTVALIQAASIFSQTKQKKKKEKSFRTQSTQFRFNLI